MTAQIIEAPQGSDAWHQHRASHFNGSDAPAMLGVSPHRSRHELLREKATGLTEEVDAQTQLRFDKGHKYEALARPWAEEIIGEELYPVVLADEIDGLPLSVSVDGLTLLSDIAWEHKTLNERLAEALDQGEIPSEYHPQMEQALMLSGAERCLFMASAGDRESMRCAWYESRPDLRQQLIAGWKQFADDLANYQPREEKPEAVGRSPENLPALRIEVEGAVKTTNLPEFRSHALAVFEGINTDLQTDEDFADAEQAVKWCKEVEGKLDAAKDHALSQTASIDELFRTVDDIKEQARQKRLELDKLVKARKQAIRDEVVQGAKQALREHVDSLNAGIQGADLPPVDADFAGAIKGKKTVKSVRDATDQELARAKIAANEAAEHIRANLARYGELTGGEYATLFPDLQTLVQKPAEDMAATVKARIAEHNEREEQRREAERERIRQEEQRKAVQAENTPRSDSQEAKEAPTAAVDAEKKAAAGAREEQAPAADDGARLKLSDINARIAPLSISAAGLSELGIEPVGRDKAAKLYRAADFAEICGALIRRLQDARQSTRKAA